MIEFLLNNENLWLVQIVFGVAILMTFGYLLKHVVRVLRQKAQAHKQDWRHHLDYIFLVPSKFLLWILGVYYLLAFTFGHFGQEAYVVYLSPLRNALIVFCISWSLLRYFQQLLTSLSRKKNISIDPTSLELLKKFFNIAVIFIASLMILQMLGLNILPLIAFGGIGAAALGFAGKDMFGNFFGGVMLHVSRPFTKGDHIAIPHLHIQGEVEKIGWYFTLVRDQDKCLLYLPNAIYSTSYVINESRRTHRKIEEKIPVRFSDFSKMEDIVEQMQKLLEKEPTLDRTIPFTVSFSSISSYSLDIIFKVYTLETREQQYLLVKQRLLCEIQKILATKQAELALPMTMILNGK